MPIPPQLRFMRFGSFSVTPWREYYNTTVSVECQHFLKNNFTNFLNYFYNTKNTDWPPPHPVFCFMQNACGNCRCQILRNRKKEQNRKIGDPFEPPIFFDMQLAGLEPAPTYMDMNLNHARMPIPPQLLNDDYYKGCLSKCQSLFRNFLHFFAHVFCTRFCAHFIMVLTRIHKAAPLSHSAAYAWSWYFQRISSARYFTVPSTPR